VKRLFLEDEPVYTPKDLAASRQGFEARGGLSGDRIQIPRDRGFADSPLEGDGFELSVPRQSGYGFET
jgi:hypothetical protein